MFITEFVDPDNPQNQDSLGNPYPGSGYSTFSDPELTDDEDDTAAQILANQKAIEFVSSLRAKKLNDKDIVIERLGISVFFTKKDSAWGRDSFCPATDTFMDKLETLWEIDQIFIENFSYPNLINNFIYYYLTDNNE